MLASCKGEVASLTPSRPTCLAAYQDMLHSVMLLHHCMTGWLHSIIIIKVCPSFCRCLSYPFFDPVLTDRAFLTAPSTMLVSFCLAGIVAGLFIFFFGFLGIYGNMVAVLQPGRCVLPPLVALSEESPPGSCKQPAWQSTSDTADSLLHSMLPQGFCCKLRPYSDRYAVEQRLSIASP